jgi:hypothetical protein
MSFYTVDIKLIRIQICHVMTQNIYLTDSVGYYTIV